MGVNGTADKVFTISSPADARSSIIPGEGRTGTLTLVGGRGGGGVGGINLCYIVISHTIHTRTFADNCSLVGFPAEP